MTTSSGNVPRSKPRILQSCVIEISQGQARFSRYVINHCQFICTFTDTWSQSTSVHQLISVYILYALTWSNGQRFDIFAYGYVSLVASYTGLNHTGIIINLDTWLELVCITFLVFILHIFFAKFVISVAFGLLHSNADVLSTGNHCPNVCVLTSVGSANTEVIHFRLMILSSVSFALESIQTQKVVTNVWFRLHFHICNHASHFSLSSDTKFDFHAVVQP